MPANPERGEHDLKVGDRTYTCVLKTRGMMALQQRFGLTTLEELDEKVFQVALRGSFEHLAAVFWASLLKYHPEVTFEQAVNIMDEFDDLGAFNDALFGVAESAMPDPKDIEELKEDAVADRPPKARPRGAGVTSISKRAAAG